MARRVHQVHRLALGRHDRFGQVHRLGGGRRFIEERGVGDRQAGEIGHQGLEVEQGLEPALRDLRLIGSVGGIPARVLEDVALDHLRREGPVVPHAEVGAKDPVLGRETAEGLQHFAFTPAGWQVQWLGQPDVRRDYGISERVQRVVAQFLHHGLDVVSTGPNVSRDEAVGAEQGIGGWFRHAR